MKGKFLFREPLLSNDDGSYFTAAQMQFFLNRPKGKEQFRTCSKEFVSYFNNCCIYNLVYDMMEDDPTCAFLYWDEINNCMCYSFPKDGEVAKAVLLSSAEMTDPDHLGDWGDEEDRENLYFD